MTTLYENYNTGDNNDQALATATWWAETFTVGVTPHTITSVKLKLYKTGTPGVFTVSIRAVDGDGKPTGSDLTSGTYDGNSLGASPGIFVEIALTEYQLSASTKYAIVCRAASGNVFWRLNTGGYSGGGAIKSGDSGATWGNVQGYAFMFEVWGNAGATQVSVSDSGVGTDSPSIRLPLAETGVGTDARAITGRPSVSESGAGSDAVPSIRIPLAESGLGADSVTQISFTLTESGVGIDIFSYVVLVNVSDSGSGVEISSIRIPCADAGIGSEVLTSISLTLVDLGVASDAAQTSVFLAVLNDSGVGIEVAYPELRLSDSGVFTDVWSLGPPLIYVVENGVATEVAGISFNLYDNGLLIELAYLGGLGVIQLDGLDLPHVQGINVEEPSIVQDLPVMDALPYRKQLGKMGRTVTIQGWTDSLTTLETLRGYNDGEKHLLVLPTGDSMMVHVTDVQTPEAAENLDRYDYALSTVEVD